MSKSNYSFYLSCDIYRALRARALLNTRSVSQEVEHIVTEALLKTETGDLKAANLVRTFQEEQERRKLNQLYASS